MLLHESLVVKGSDHGFSDARKCQGTDKLLFEADAKTSHIFPDILNITRGIIPVNDPKKQLHISFPSIRSGVAVSPMRIFG